MHNFGRKLLIAAGAASLLMSASASAADVKAGVDAWQAGNYGAAIAQWRPLAERGDADAQFNLGQAYKLGRGVNADIKIAQNWYQKAAQQGHEQAQANLGLILFQNGNRAGAMPWLKKAAESDDPRAQYVYGTALFNGDLIAKDWPRAYAMMQRAAAQGLPQAASQLAEMDKYIPLQERRQGIALARRLEQGAPTAPVPPAPRVAPPSQRTAPSPAAAVPAAGARGGWKVQLGAFGNIDNARRHWEAISRKAGFAGLQPIMTKAGAMTRLQAGPIANRAAADRICAVAKSAGSACFPVAP
ncbi:SPOR domain-containing protein [Sphingosinicella rhizophila]|uniref:SPOR domain-containing protein n=1 Tax=Sphingosinicella rhizophila TaxID=3050082 RepID=A0ABU3Q4E2_9SPHN|nr:SPOR domain-containing protein [Sphingosinicella sp. GR2756]MDT9597805.1 SPOR domain-containing protein [Sphingosinicella sp. GR2756]